MRTGFLFARDPRWIVAKYKGRCAKCPALVKPGDRVFYWPASRELHCAACGTDEAAEFECARQDEEFMRGQYARPL